MDKSFLFLILCFSLQLGFFTTVEARQNPYIDQANSYAKNGNYSEALKMLNSAIDLNSRDARAYKIRGHVHYAMGNHLKAITDLDHVVSLVPDSPNALADRAIVHSVMGNHGLALADIEAALTLKPSSFFAQSIRKEILERAR